jgi:hypothetical protein
MSPALMTVVLVLAAVAGAASYLTAYWQMSRAYAGRKPAAGPSAPSRAR